MPGFTDLPGFDEVEAAERELLRNAGGRSEASSEMLSPMPAVSAPLLHSPPYRIEIEKAEPDGSSFRVVFEGEVEVVPVAIKLARQVRGAGMSTSELMDFVTWSDGARFDDEERLEAAVKQWRSGEECDPSKW